MNPLITSLILEDDILLTDADFFLKLRCFNQAFGNQYLLMPNRIETMEHQGQLRRFYIDGDYNPAASEAYRLSIEPAALCLPISERWCDSSSPRTFILDVFSSIASRRASYAGSGHAAAIDTSFHGPLESAATLGHAQDFPADEACAQKRSLPHR